MTAAVALQSRSRADPLSRYLNPLSLFRHLWSHAGLISQFTRREVRGRYPGSFLGVLWSFVNPVVLLATYTFVFGMVFAVRWPQGRVGGLGEFALVLFCGLIVYNLFSECVGRAAGLVVAVPNYVKRVVFPLEILPVSVVGSALFHALMGLAVLLLFKLVLTGGIPATVVFLPLLAVPLVMVSLGLTWFLAGLGVFVRDVGYVVNLGLQVLLFATPIFYPLSEVGPRLRVILSLNPLAYVVENFRRVTLWGVLPDWDGLGIWTLVCGVLMVLGYAWFMKTKRGFADVV
jgi:lipopolysaccharide transport system permease protein